MEELPIEGVLLTLRVDAVSMQGVTKLLDGLELDPLCCYLVVFAFDADQINSEQTRRLVEATRARPRVLLVEVLMNPSRSEGEAFNVCEVWDMMAVAAWQHGAAWVTVCRIYTSSHPDLKRPRSPPHAAPISFHPRPWHFLSPCLSC